MLNNSRVTMVNNRVRMQRRKNIGYSIIILFLIAVIVFLTRKLILQPEQAHASDGGYTVYENIVINEQDSLWSIAQKYGSNYNGTIHEYVAILRSINNLNSDTIEAGECLIVPLHVTHTR